MAEEEFGATFAGYVAILEFHESYINIIIIITDVIKGLAELT